MRKADELSIDALEAVPGQFFDKNVLTPEFHGLAGRARAGQQLQRLHREVAFLEAADHLDAHGAGRARNGDDGIGIHFRYSGPGS